MARCAGAREAVPPLRWWRGWELLVALPLAVVLFVPATWPRWAFMWTLTVALYSGCKWLTWRRSTVRGAPLARHLGYLFAWPGLDADAFLNPSPTHPPRKPPAWEWALAATQLALGVGLLFGVARWVPAEHPYVVGWVGMIGLALALHFGLLQLFSCAWRRAGVAACPLMDWPFASVSLGEFWGRRWNTAFRDFTHRFFFRPLTPRLGARGALAVGFVFSGLVHELAISVPAGGGYGGPCLFFLLQGSALLAERSPVGRQLGLGAGWRGWLFTLVVLIVPAAALFHPPFVTAVIVPFMHALGAL